MAAKTVVVLGGGTGGIVAARALRRRLGSEDRVVLVERDPISRFAPSFLWVMTGARRAAQSSAGLPGLGRLGIEVAEAAVEGVDPERQRVSTSTGELSYDRLVVALGAELDPGALPGFSEGAHNLYTLDGAEAAGQALASLESGRVAVLVSRLPYKCPAAPYEAAFLIDAFLKKRGVRDRVTVDVHTPEPLPMPTAGVALGTAVAQMLEARGIGFHSGRSAERVDAGARRLEFADGERADYDVLIGIPPHRAPAAVAASGLAGPTGFVPVDRHSLATAVEGVHAVGDVTQIPLAGGFALPKAGVFAHAEAGVVAERIAAELTGREPRSVFDGRGSCFLELGGGMAGYASGDFFAQDAPQVRMRRPGPHWHLAKVAFERYWMMRMLRGR